MLVAMEIIQGQVCVCPTWTLYCFKIAQDKQFNPHLDDFFLRALADNLSSNTVDSVVDLHSFYLLIDLRCFGLEPMSSNARWRVASQNYTVQ